MNFNKVINRMHYGTMVITSLHMILKTEFLSQNKAIPKRLQSSWH